MSVLDTVAGLVVGLLAALLLMRTRRNRLRISNQVPLTWCGNCSQPTSALCYEHKQQAAQAGRDIAHD